MQGAVSLSKHIQNPHLQVSVFSLKKNLDVGTTIKTLHGKYSSEYPEIPAHCTHTHHFLDGCHLDVKTNRLIPGIGSQQKALHKVRFSAVHVFFVVSPTNVPKRADVFSSLSNPWLIISNLQRHEGDLREDHMESVGWRSASNKKGTKTL